MVEIKSIDLLKNEIEYDDGTIVTYEDFKDRFISFWNLKIAGETLSPFDMERFMKRGSSKNLEQLLKGKKAEGFFEASFGKKMDPGMLKMILILVLVGVVAAVAIFILKGMGLM